MIAKSKFLILSLSILAVITAIIIIVKATSGHKLSEAGAKLAAEKRATLNFLQPTPTPPDIKVAQELIESNPDISAYIKDSEGNFKAVLRYQRIVLHQTWVNSKQIFEYRFHIDIEKGIAKFLAPGEHPIKSLAEAMQLVSKSDFLRDINRNHYYIFTVVTAWKNIEKYIVMVEEYISTDFDKASKMVSQRFFDVDLEKNTVIETEAPN